VIYMYNLFYSYDTEDEVEEVKSRPR